MPKIATEFPFSKVAHAAGIAGTTLNKWGNEGVFPSSDRDKISQGKGVARSLTYTTAISIIIMGELTRRKVPLKIAAQAAREFAYSDSAGSGGRLKGEVGAAREICDVFKTGKTFLVICGDKDDPRIKLANVDPNKPFHSEWRKLLPYSEGSSASLVDLNDLLFTRARALGVDVDHFQGDAS